MRIPVATYRVQLNSAFGFRQLQHILPFLHSLGISHVYASPIFKARKGSEHGYDMVDPNRLNREMGSEAEFDQLLGELKNYGMGWIQDFVPNHMAFDPQNRMLMDFLENGPDSQYYNFFDVTWEHTQENFRNKILAPFLGRFYGQCLEDGEIQLRYDENGFSVVYYNLQFPLRIDSYSRVLTHEMGRLRRSLGRKDSDLLKFLGVIYTLKNLPSAGELNERINQISFVKSLLWELYNQNEKIKNFMNRNIEIFNGQPGHPESFDLLDELLSDQFFRLSFWKVGTEEINYRRFFTVNDLISLRIEDEQVFRHIHKLVGEWVSGRKIDGLRIDHVDGLYDPTGYVRKLRKDFGGFYLVVEKITEMNETLPPDWPVQGTTGYDFLNFVNGVFCQRASQNRFDRIYRRFTDSQTSFPFLVHQKKRLIIGKHLAGDVDNLARLLSGISNRYRYGSDFTLYGLKRALVEILAWFPVYRTYIRSPDIRDEEETYINEAIDRAKSILPDFVNEMEFIRNVLLLNTGETMVDEEQQQWIHFIMRFQQLTGPLMAKGVEDTALYCYNRLLSLNEVGGNPDKFGVSDIEFHYFNKKRAEEWPHTMNATSTHDTKRGEDIRARLNVLSEKPGEWEQNVKLWSKINRKKKRKVNGEDAPDRNDEYFLYQTLIGTYPFGEEEIKTYPERIKSYLIKSVREAKIHTAWLKPDHDYENAYLSFLEEILSEDHPFLWEFIPFQRRIARYGILNSLSQLLIKLTAPGIPDFYQGTELWDLSLVDPDNRRPVDFEKRRSILQQILRRDAEDNFGLIQDLLNNPVDGGIKLFLMYKGLNLRKNRKEIFNRGSYVRLEKDGRYKDHLIAFGRNLNEQWIVTVVPRFLTGLIHEHEYPVGTGLWEDTCIQIPVNISVWSEAITGRKMGGGEQLLVGKILREFPVAVLTGEQD